MLPNILCDTRIKYLKEYARYANEYLSGAVAEVGMYKGGSLEIIAMTAKDKFVFGFDTFEGLPEPQEVDSAHHKKGDFSDTNYNEIKEYFSNNFGDRVEIVKGLFPDSVDKDRHCVEYSFVHLDVDFYESYASALNFFWPLMVEGGIIICDDYGWKGTPGAKIAIDEFFSSRKVKEKRQLLPSIQYLIIK